jgi:DNA mismatch repair protein MutL
MPQIKELDASTILQLAAGEIIDRPVSIVKEVVENAIDAGATQINVCVTQGGISEIKVADNGSGIHKDDLALALTPHATSKLGQFNDIQSLRTMGFRGEALASIAEVADVSIVTCQEGEDIGHKLTKLGREDNITLSQEARPTGTTITISHVFKRIPVRYRFLKTPASECNVIYKTMQQFSLHYPHIAFTLHHNDAELLHTSGSGDLLTQFKHALKLNTDDALGFSKVTHGITVSGVVTAPNITFKNRQKCWFSVNQRLVSSPVFFKALQQGLIDVMPKQTFPAIVCNIDCPTEDIDINIHPKKEDVKFVHSDHIFLAIKRAVQSAIIQGPQTWRDAHSAVGSQAPNLPPGISVIEKPPTLTESLPTPIMATSTPIPNAMSQSSNYSNHPSEPIYPPSQSLNNPPSIPINTENNAQESPIPTTKQEPLMATESQITWVSFKHKYILVPTKDYVLIFDQHAVHERILYDQFKKDSIDDQMIGRPLLIPEYIQLSEPLVPLIKEYLPAIHALGIHMEPFDDTTFIIREVPYCFSNLNITDWLNDWIHDPNIQGMHNAPITKIKEVIQMKACKAAVKAGQKLHDYEVTQLIQSCLESDTQFTCPHGRPLYIQLAESNLDALFLRS